MKNKIVFIIIYLGEFPWYFPYFLKSCAFNPDIDFKIFSDNNIPPSVKPSNVELINYSLDQFNKDAAIALSIDIKLREAYKLCDFKPAYGYIFAEYIKEYDFWGYCDIDLIFGNVRRFMDDELLSKYDVISARHDYLTGCFALYRNKHNINTLFKQSKDWKKVFIDNANFFFDETNFAFEEFGNGVHYSLIKTEIESMTHVVRRLYEEKEINAYFEFQIVEGFAGNMLWEKGEIIYRRQFEVMLYHMVRFKKIYSENNDINRFIPDKFRIGKKKIYY